MIMLPRKSWLFSAFAVSLNDSAGILLMTEKLLRWRLRSAG